MNAKLIFLKLSTSSSSNNFLVSFGIVIIIFVIQAFEKISICLEITLFSFTFKRLLGVLNG
jgi:hypothetical protein